MRIDLGGLPLYARSASVKDAIAGRKFWDNILGVTGMHLPSTRFPFARLPERLAS